MRSQKHINILFVLQTFGTGGSERIVMDLCENIDRKKFNPFVVGLVDGLMKEDLKKIKIETLCVNKVQHNILKVMTQISKFIKEHQIDIINAHHFTPFFYSFYGGKRHGCKIFYTGHTSNEIDLIHGFWSMVGKILLHFSDGAIAISEGVSSSIMKKFHLRKNKIFKIINAVDHQRFQITIDPIQKREQLNIKKEDHVIGIVSSLRRQKNHDNLIKAFNIVLQKINTVKLLIVGSGIGKGKREKDLRTLVKELGLGEKVIFLGARSDIPEILKVMDIYCLPSFFEGLPISLLEAMSAKLPVVGTAVMGIRDVIRNEKTGLLVPSNNPERLAEALIRLLNNPDLRKELSENGYRYILENHDKDKWINHYEQLFSNQCR